MKIKKFKRIFLYHQKDIKSSEWSQAHQKDDLSRKLDQKSDHQKVDLQEEDLTLKACSARLKDIF